MCLLFHGRGDAHFIINKVRVFIKAHSLRFVMTVNYVNMFTGIVRMGPLSDRVDAIIGCQTSCCSAVKVSSQTVDKAVNVYPGKACG